MGFLIMPAPEVEAPGAVTASVDSTTATTATISWTGGSGATAFNVFRSGSSGSKGSEVANGVTSPWQDTGLTAETPYWYTVEAENGAGTTDSNQVEATTQAASGSDLIHVTWGTATGTGDSAVEDGGLLEAGIHCTSNRASVMEVITAAAAEARGLDPWTRTANVLSIRSNQFCAHTEALNLFPLPDGSDQYWVYRYWMAVGTGMTDTKQHPFCHAPVGSIEIVHAGIDNLSGSTWGLRQSIGEQATANSGSSPAGGPLFPWRPMNGASQRALAKDSWYRVEHILHWYTSTRFRWYPRLYNQAGNLLNDYTTWQHSDGAGTLESYYAAGRYFTRKSDSSGVDRIRGVSFGMGQAGSSNGYFYAADFKAKLGTSISDFIGTD